MSASVNESKVTLTISHTDSANILGYEIRRNGKAIAFTTEASYVDDLGAANNLTYTYSVVPVDKLGNLGAEAQAEEGPGGLRQDHQRRPVPGGAGRGHPHLYHEERRRRERHRHQGSPMRAR